MSSGKIFDKNANNREIICQIIAKRFRDVWDSSAYILFLWKKNEQDRETKK